MWFKKHKQLVIEAKPETNPEQVKCETCKHWVDKTDCQEVLVENGCDGYKTYFCPIHKVKYDLIRCGAFFKIVPTTEQEVNEQGKPIINKRKRIDLGDRHTCLRCQSQMCNCPQRQKDGSWKEKRKK